MKLIFSPRVEHLQDNSSLQNGKWYLQEGIGDLQSAVLQGNAQKPPIPPLIWRLKLSCGALLKGGGHKGGGYLYMRETGTNVANRRSDREALRILAHKWVMFGIFAL